MRPARWLNGWTCPLRGLRLTSAFFPPFRRREKGRKAGAERVLRHNSAVPSEAGRQAGGWLVSAAGSQAEAGRQGACRPWVGESAKRGAVFFIFFEVAAPLLPSLFAAPIKAYKPPASLPLPALCASFRPQPPKRASLLPACLPVVRPFVRSRNTHSAPAFLPFSHRCASYVRSRSQPNPAKGACPPIEPPRRPHTVVSVCPHSG